MQIFGWVLLVALVFIIRVTALPVILLIAVSSDRPASWLVIGVFVGVLHFLDIRRSVRMRRFEKDLRRVRGQDEMIELIRSRAISYFVMSRKGEVQVGHTYRELKDGPVLHTEIFADPQGYPAYVSAYVAAASDVGQHQGHVTAYLDRVDSPPHNTRSRWVTVDEATVLLRGGEIEYFFFAFADGSERNRVRRVDDPTGIMLIEKGRMHHLVVDPALAPAMIPIVLDAQRRCGTPKFVVNGHDE